MRIVETTNRHNISIIMFMMMQDNNRTVKMPTATPKYDYEDGEYENDDEGTAAQYDEHAQYVDDAE